MNSEDLTEENINILCIILGFETSYTMGRRSVRAAAEL
jgi:hypothetical protein